MDRDPHQEYEQQWGHPGTTRGIRSGAAARRRRTAYIQHRVAQGEAEDQVAVIHQGGQARPLYTSRSWEPNPDSSGDEEVQYPEPRRTLSELGSVTLVPRASLYQPVRSAVIPRATGPSDPYGKGGPRPKAAAASSSSSAVVDLETATEVVEVEDESDPYRFSGPLWHQAFPHPGLPPVTEPFGFRSRDLTPARLHPSVKSYLWSADQSSLIKVEQDIARLTGSAIVFDWHQVLDTDRASSRTIHRVGEDGQIPWRHKRTLLELSQLCRKSARPIHLVICSHIESSSTNLENLIHATEQSGLPVQLVLVTVQRTGPQGKLAALRSGISGNFCLFDDNQEIIDEFVAASRHIGQVLKPRARRSSSLPDFCTGWSISSDPLYPTARKFVESFSRSSA